MTDQDSGELVRTLFSRVSVLEAELKGRALSDAYGRFYAAMAVGAMALALMPILEDVVETSDGVTRRSHYGTLWEMASNPGGEPAVLGILLVTGFVALLAAAAVRVRSSEHPIGIAVTGFVLLLMLITKPGTGTPTPDLTSAGMAGVALALASILIGGTHAIHLHVRSMP